MNYSFHNAQLVTAERITRAPLHITNGHIASNAAADGLHIDLSGYLVFPGLINAHDHLPLNSIPPLPDHPPFPNSYAWISAFQPYFRQPAVAAALAIPERERLQQGALKNLLCGVTTVMHHDPWHSAFADPNFPVRVVKHYGWSHSIGLAPVGTKRAASHLPPATCLLPTYGPPLPDSYYTTPPDHPWVIHLAEGTDELASSELALLDQLGCLQSNTVLVHGVGIDEQGIEKLIGSGAGLVWCPASNLRLLGHTVAPPFLERLAATGRLALGSDSRISGAFDLLAELRVAAANSALPLHTLLELVTSAAARLLRLPNLGGLAPGMEADLLVLPDPGGDPYKALINAQRGDVQAVVRGGRLLVADQTLAQQMPFWHTEPQPIAIDGKVKLLDRGVAPLDGV